MRLFAFGDSVTYGHGLQDCYIPHTLPSRFFRSAYGPMPSKHAWPSLCGERLDLQICNLSHPGSSNQRILDALRASDITSQDIAVFMWSFVDRGRVAQADRVLDLGPWTADDHPWFFEAYDDHALVYTSKTAIEHAQLWCDAQGIKHLMFSNTVYDHDELDGIMICDFQRFQCDMALDDLHPGPASHVAFSDFLHAELIKII